MSKYILVIGLLTVAACNPQDLQAPVAEPSEEAQELVQPNMGLQCNRSVDLNEDSFELAFYIDAYNSSCGIKDLQTETIVGMESGSGIGVVGIIKARCYAQQKIYRDDKDEYGNAGQWTFTASRVAVIATYNSSDRLDGTTVVFEKEDCVEVPMEKK